MQNLRQDEEVFKLISDCLPPPEESKRKPAELVKTPLKDAMKSSYIPPLTCVKEDNEEDEPSQMGAHSQRSNTTPIQLSNNSPREETTTERKGFFVVKQPSLLSTGNFILPETLTVSSPENAASSYPILTKFGESDAITD